MQLSQSTLIRISTIDRCLQNRERQWTLEDLIDACNKELSLYEGHEISISRRTICYDISRMRSKQFGYNAPIKVHDKKYYYYTDSKYSISKHSAKDSIHDPIASTLKCLDELQYARKNTLAIDVICKLRESISNRRSDASPIMDIEVMDRKQEKTFACLYDAVARQKTVKIALKKECLESDDDNKPKYFYPYLLKEYRGQWFLLYGEIKKDYRKHRHQICDENMMDALEINSIAIDAISNVEVMSNYKYYRIKDFDPVHYFDNVIGAKRNVNAIAKKVVIKFDSLVSQEVISSPLHSSQRIEQVGSNGVIKISLLVIVNRELERLILSYGEHAEVIEPERLQQRISDSLRKASSRYSNG